MKRFNPQTFSGILIWAQALMLAVPNVALSAAGQLPPVAAAANILLPAGIYLLLMSWSGNIGRNIVLSPATDRDCRVSDRSSVSLRRRLCNRRGYVSERSYHQQLRSHGTARQSRQCSHNRYDNVSAGSNCWNYFLDKRNQNLTPTAPFRA